MSARLLEVADAVVAELNGGSFGVTFTAVRAYRPRFKPAELTDLTVTVVPRTWTAALATRSAQDREFVVDIGVMQRIADDANATIDPVVSLGESFIGHFLGAALDALPTAVCVGAANDPVFAPEHLEAHRVVTSIVTLTYREVT